MPDYPHQLPEAIAQRLEAFRRKLWWMKAAEAVMAAVFGLLAAFLLVFILDRFFDTPAWMRVTLLVAGTSLLAIFAPHWLHRWLWKHRRADQLARLVRRAHPRFGDRLLGAVELATQDATQTSLSPVLRAAALRQIAEETVRRKTLDDALPPSRHRRWASIVGLLALATAGGFLVAPEAGWNSFIRWLAPLGDTPRFTFTQLDPTPATRIVPLGEPFTIDLRLADASRQLPDVASVQVGADMPFTIRRDGRHFPFTFDGLLTPQTLRFSVGDAHPAITVTPMARPAITSIQGLVSYPDYLGIQAEPISIENGRLTMVEGSSARIDGRATRTLAQAAAKPIEGALGDTPVLQTDGAAFASARALPAPPIPPPPADAPPGFIPEATGRFAISLTDTHGLEMKEPFIVTIRTLPDTAPNVYLEGTSRELSILDDETLEFRAIAGDDFGVKRLGFDWTTVPDGNPLPADAAPTGESILGNGASLARKLEAPAVFSPESLKLGPQTLRLRAWAEDYKPGRPRVFSQPVTVIIMDRSQHAEMLRRRFGQLMDSLEELSRREETDHEENKRLENLDAGEMRAPPNQKRLDDQKNAEQRNQESMEQLSGSAKDLFRDALRNKDMDPSTMKDWSEMLKQLGELAEKDIPTVKDLLEQAADAENNSPAKQDTQMSRAVAEQQKVLEKMREAMRKANRVEQNMEAGTFVNRLRSAARVTKGLAGALRENLLRGITQGAPSRTGGLNPESLAKDDFTDLLESAKRQDRTGRELTDLQDDFGHFFRRTGKEIYEEIRREMETARTSDAFDRLSIQIKQNWLGRTTPELLAWADTLNAWADKLDPKKAAGAGGGGGAGGMSPEDSEVELMLRLLRFVQQTQDIQGQTRRVEHGKQELVKPANPAPVRPPPPPAPPADPNPL